MLERKWTQGLRVGSRLAVGFSFRSLSLEGVLRLAEDKGGCTYEVGVGVWDCFHYYCRVRCLEEIRGSLALVSSCEIALRDLLETMQAHS
jgi:hypothetical protein